MKAKQLQIALGSIKGAVSPDRDAVLLRKGSLHTTDGVWWMTYSLPEVEGHMVLPFAKFLGMVKTLDPDADVQLEQRNVECIIRSGTTVWKLPLKESEFDEEPVSDKPKPIEGSGFEFVEAFKGLKHLIRLDLSRPGLLVAYVDDEGNMLIGDGARLGARPCGLPTLEIPLPVLQEVARLLTLEMTETVQWWFTSQRITVGLRNCVFSATIPETSFEQEWYHRMMSFLVDAKAIAFSRAELLDALGRVEVTSGLNLVTMRFRGASVVLESRDETGGKCVTRVAVEGELEGDIVLDLRHLKMGVESRLSDSDAVVMSVGEKAIRLEDEESWELIVKQESI